MIFKLLSSLVIYTKKCSSGGVMVSWFHFYHSVCSAYWCASRPNHFYRAEVIVPENHNKSAGPCPVLELPASCLSERSGLIDLNLNPCVGVNSRIFEIPVQPN